MSYSYFSHQRKIATRTKPAKPLRAVTRCLCGAENKTRGKVVGPACWAAAPGNLRREVYDHEYAVRLEAARSLVAFALSRKETK